MNDICQFIPPKDYPSELAFIHFVYEAELKKHKQPFVYRHYYVHAVFKGTAVLTTEGNAYPLKRGDVFFTHPYQSFTLDADDDFTFMYISFNGDGAARLLEEHDIRKNKCVFYNLEQILIFWIESIRRVKPSNANTLTESVLLYTLSFIDGGEIERFKKTGDKFDSILDYLNHNFTSNDISLRKVADIFFYTEKHLSHLFVKKTGNKFTQHINTLRVQYAVRLMEEGATDLYYIATRCGFSDKFYFAKVFKKIIGKTPTEYIKKLHER